MIKIASYELSSGTYDIWSLINIDKCDTTGKIEIHLKVNPWKIIFSCSLSKAAWVQKRILSGNPCLMCIIRYKLHRRSIRIKVLGICISVYYPHKQDFHDAIGHCASVRSPSQLFPHILVWSYVKKLHSAFWMFILGKLKHLKNFCHVIRETTEFLSLMNREM